MMRHDLYVNKDLEVFSIQLLLYTVPHKKGATDFFAVTFTNMDDFRNFLCTTSQENAKVIDARVFCHIFVMLLPYRVEVSDTKVTHFTQY